MITPTEPPKMIDCELCTTTHPENVPCPNCSAWARIATKARKARREWVKRDVRKPYCD